MYRTIKQRPMKLNTEPKIKTEVKQMCNIITEIDNPYLQAWADAGAYVMIHSGFWIMTDMGWLWFKITEDAMHLECIAVSDKERGKGKGTRLMEYVTHFADETGIPVTLEVAVVTNGNYCGMPHPVVGMGQSKKDKIPVGKLPKWYSKFGFVKTPEYTVKKRSMIYTPKKK